jgi:N utilization substance protein B
LGNSKFSERTRARIQALQLLFQAEAVGRSVDDVLDGEYALSDGPLDEYGRELALGVDGIRHSLDRAIARHSHSWSIGRMPAVDLNLMRIALYEMTCIDDVEIPVAIDEAVELAKAFGSDDTSRFINGLLGRLADDIQAGVDVLSDGSDEEGDA